MTKSAIRWGLSCLSVGLLACPDDSPLLEISSHQAALTASENSERTLEGLLDAADFLAESTSMAETLNAFGGGSEDCSSSATSCSAGDSSCAPPETVCTSNELSAADLEESRQEIRENAQELVRELRERILIPENLESETDTSATYRLGPSVLCPPDDAPDVAPGAAPSVPVYDPDCVEQANRYQPRLRLTSPSEGDVDVTVLIGQRKRAPLVFELHHQSLGVRLDLGEALAVARDLGEDTESIEHLSGVLQLALVENGPRDYSFELNVLEALQGVMNTDDGKLQVSLAATSQTLELRLDGNARRLSAGVDLGALRVLGPLGMFADMFEGGETIDAPVPAYDANTGTYDYDTPVPVEPPARSYQGMLEFVLAGLEGTLEYVADSDVLNLNGLGFGNTSSTIKHDARTLFALDLNAALGRHVDLVVEPAGDGAKISISPGFDLSLAFAFQQIQDQFDNLSDYLLDDTVHIWFEGASPALVAADEQLRVDSGTLHLDTSAHPAENLSVAAGMCLSESSAEEEGQSSPWGDLGASVCQ